MNATDMFLSYAYSLIASTVLLIFTILLTPFALISDHVNFFRSPFLLLLRLGILVMKDISEEKLKRDPWSKEAMDSIRKANKELDQITKYLRDLE